MHTAEQLKKSLADFIAQEEPTKAETAIYIAEFCLGWPYVWGGYGQYCTVSNRNSYAERSTCPAGEKTQIRKKCQVLNGAKDSCTGCKYYPGAVVRFFDCRGFTRWVLGQIGITLNGAGATSQWNDNSNWVAKGPISEMPKDQVCCIFMQNQKDHKTMEHTGFHIGGGDVIHCSGEVKRGKITDKGWTHYAVPKGLDGSAPVPTPTTDKPTLRKGSKGEYVTLAQTKLLMLGYDLGKWGADGSFGAKTQEAVMKFQADRGLKVDGIIGAGTWAELDKGSIGEDLYTVTIPHMKKSDADELAKRYANVVCVKE